MSLATSSDRGGQTHPLPTAAPTPPASDRDSTNLSSSPPSDSLETRPVQGIRDALRRPRVRDPPSPRRTTSSPSPPPHIVSTARHSSIGECKRDGSHTRGRVDDRLGTSGRGSASGRVAVKHTPGSGRASVVLPASQRGSSGGLRRIERNENASSSKHSTTTEKLHHRDENAVADGAAQGSYLAEESPGVAKNLSHASSNRLRRSDSSATRATSAKKKSRAAARTIGTLRQKDTEGLVASASASGRRSLSHKAPATSAFSPTRATATTVTGTGNSGYLPLSGSASRATSERATAPPSASTSAVVEAFLLRMQNCLSKQELLFQRLNLKLAKVAAASPTHAGSASLSVASPQPRRPLSLSPNNETGSDGEPDAASMRCSVGTPAETHLGSVATGDHPAPDTSRTFNAAMKAGSPSTLRDTDLMPSFDSQPHALSSPLTPSCSVVVVHPTLERVTNHPTASFLLPSEEPAQPTAASQLTSPHYLRLNNIEATASTSATASSLSEQLGLLSSSASGTPPSPAQLRSTQRRRAGGSPNPIVPVTAAASAFSSQSGVARSAPVSFDLDAGATKTASHNEAYGDRYCQQEDPDAEGEDHPAAYAAAPTRRSSAIQWEGGADVPHTPSSPLHAASSRSTRVGGAGDDFTPFLEGASPLISSSNPPPLPILSSSRHNFSGSLSTSETHGTWSVSPPGAAVGTSLRLATVSNAMSLLTSIDSVTLSPLSRPMSMWGGSPMTHSVHSGGSPGQQPRHAQHFQQGTMLMMSSSFNASGGTPVSTRSPPRTAGRGSGSGSPQRRHTAPDRSSLHLHFNSGSGGGAAAKGTSSTGVASSSPYSPALFNFVSPPSAAAISSRASPVAVDSAGGVRLPQLQTNVLSSSSSMLSSRNATAACLPVPPHMCRVVGDALSPLSASSSSPSSTPPTMSRRTSVLQSRNAAKPASDNFFNYSCSFVSANSQDEEARATVSEHPHPRHREMSYSPTRADTGAPTLSSFPEREDIGDVAGNTESNFVVVSVRSPVSGSGSVTSSPHALKKEAAAESTPATASAAAPTHRQLALSASPSLERGGRGDGELDGSFKGKGVAQDDTKGGFYAASGDGDATDSDESADAEEDGKPQGEGQTHRSVTTLNPFTVPPPPSSLSELHAHQQRRRLSAGPVPTMRRPPMAPPRPSNNTEEGANTTSAPAVEADGSSTPGTGTARAVQLEQWLSFERQHEQMHLPACWRDSEVVVVDHVEEEDRERDAEAEAQLRLLEAELLSGWQPSPSGSEREESQLRENAEVDAERRRRQQLSSTRRHSYPGSSSYSTDRDRPQRSGSELDSSGNNVDDEWEWDEEVEVNGSYQERLAQYGKMMLSQHRRSVYAPRHRGANAASSANSTGSPSSGDGPQSPARSAKEAGKSKSLKQEKEEHAEGTDVTTMGALRERHESATRRIDEASPSAAASASPANQSESHRLFRRGHSAPVVVADGGASDWKSLQARFDELVTIQQRVRVGEDGSGAADGAAGGLEGEEKAEPQPHGDESSDLRSNSEQLRSRRHRSRSKGNRDVSALPSVTHTSERGASSTATSSNFTRSLPATLTIPGVATSDLSDDSATTAAAAASSSFSAAAVTEKSRRGTMVYQDGQPRRSDAADTQARSLLSSPSGTGPQWPARENVTPPSPAPLFIAEATEKHGEGAQGARLARRSTSKTEDVSDTTAQDAGSIVAKKPDHSPNDGRSLSAPPDQQLRADAHLTRGCNPPLDGGATPDRQHRSSVIAVHKEPPSFLAASPPTYTVDATHATRRAVAATNTTPIPIPVAPEVAPRTMNEVPSEGEERVSNNAVRTSSSNASARDGAYDSGKEEDVEAGMEASASVVVRPPRTPRLRFIQTPRGIARPITRARVRRVAHMRGEQTGGAAEASVGEGRKDLADAPVPAPSLPDPAEKRVSTVAVPKRPLLRKTRAPSGAGDGKMATAKKRKTATASGGVGQPVSTSLTDQPPSKVTPPSLQDATAAREEGSSSLAMAMLAKTDRPASGNAATPSSLHFAQEAMEGGEIAEPLPQALSCVSFSSTTTAATAGGEEHTAIAAVPSTVSSAPKPEKRTKKVSGAAPSTAASPASVQQQPLDAEHTERAAAPANVDKPREREGEVAQHKHTERDSRRLSDFYGGGGAEATSTSESRALLRRLAQRKDRTRAMEERLRMSSGNFTSINGALTVSTTAAATTAAVSEGEEGAGANSAASTPMRSAMKSHASARAAPAPAAVATEHTFSPPPEHEEAPTTPESASLLRAPLSTSPLEDTDAASLLSHPNSAPRQVPVTEPNESPSVTFAADDSALSGQPANASGSTLAHPANSVTTGGKANTRRRLHDVRPRPSASITPAAKQSIPSSTLTTAAASAGQKRVAGTFKPSASAAAAPSAAAASTPASSLGGGLAGDGTAQGVRRGDTLRPRQRAISPQPSSVVQERRRHTIGNAPFAAMSEKPIRPTRTALHS